MLEHTSVAVTGLRKSYGKHPVLTGVSLEVRRGSRTVVLGPNGAGKSTLLEIVSTLRTPTSGTVVVEGRDVVAHTREARRLIGLTPQSNALFTGVFAPVEELSGWMRAIATVNPLTYVIDAARQVEAGTAPTEGPLAAVVLVALVAAGFAACVLALGHARRNR
ncbi:ATP-binding cassette domain-containing protein [Nocardiopsis sp. CA-288880]|uniref:ATP-binding cassette domain-containing protein n=1 Tax=Nocardiopsis sp. CA-288880 TaxID=3239995 RepID=UPI003D976994